MLCDYMLGRLVFWATSVPSAHLQPRLELDEGLGEGLLLGMEQLHAQRVRAVQADQAKRRLPQRPACQHRFVAL